MKKQRSGRFWAALAIFGLMGQVAWVVENMYLNVFIYKMFGASAGDISAMVAFSAVTATLTTVLMGAVSDRAGRRKLLICAGYMLWGMSILGFALLKKENLTPLFPTAASAAAAGVTMTIVLDCVMTFFGSTANDAAFNAWLTDSVTEGRRGAAEGVNAMMPLAAILAVFGGFMFFDLNLPQSWEKIFLIIGGAVFAIGFLGLFIIREPKIAPAQEGFWRSIVYGFTPRVMRENPKLYLALAGFILFNISIQIFMPYLILYYEVALGMANYVFIMAPAIVLASIFTVLWGRVYDKKGFVFSGLIALAALAAGYVLLFCFRDTVMVFIGSLLMMCGYLAGMAVFGAMIRSHTPAGKAGMFQGVRIFSQVLVPGVIGPYIGKLVLANAETVTNSDGTLSFIPNETIFLAALIAAVPVALFFLLPKYKESRLARLTTPFEKDMPDVPFAEYPRPQMKRDSYLCLNGPWKLAVEKGGQREGLGVITVPFPPESRLSGIERVTGEGETLVYERTFALPEGFRKDRVLLHLGAVDQRARVYVNGREACRHEGGYLPFEADITPLMTDGINRLRVEAEDPLDTDLPYGKQRRDRGGMWYTPISGIWQTVWLESVPENHIEHVRITPSLTGVTMEVAGGEEEKTVLVQLPDGGTLRRSFTGSREELTFDAPRLWTPEDPYLYPYTLLSGEDSVTGYFALRTVDIREVNGKKRICLNEKPCFFHGLLDQGYFSDGIYLPASAEGFRNDILQMKKCGFNMLRKHIKLEPELFYYYCDKYGMIVFQDMVNSGKYSFLRDTALPTLGIKKGISHRVNARCREAFEATCRGIQDALYNHPCVCYYTIFNEGWGQFDADGQYRLLKEQDPTRIYDAASGWFKEKESDVESEHVYFKPVKYKPDAGRPTVLSEFGGYVYKVPGHAFDPDNTYGYRLFKTRETFENALIALYDREVVPAVENGLAAAVYTQVSDVEEETNGLLTYDRQVLKVNPAAMTAMAGRLYAACEKANS